MPSAGTMIFDDGTATVVVFAAAEVKRPPALPSTFATSSAMQQASSMTTGGPPQQLAALAGALAAIGVPQQASPSAAKSVWQMPVSGSTRFTSSAADMSPAVAATTERACS